MNLGPVIFGFVAIILIAGMIVFVSSSQSLQVVDDFGNTTSATGNATNDYVTTVTVVGGTTTGYLALVLAALGICAGVGMLYLYGKRY